VTLSLRGSVEKIGNYRERARARGEREERERRERGERECVCGGGSERERERLYIYNLHIPRGLSGEDRRIERERASEDRERERGERGERGEREERDLGGSVEKIGGYHPSLLSLRRSQRATA